CLLSSWSNTNSVVYSAPTLSDSYVSWQETTSYVTSFLSNDTPTAADVTVSDITTVQTIDTSASTDSGSSEPTRTATLTDSELEFNEAPFLSFEEWKKQTLEKAGQSNVNIGNRGGSGNKEARRRDGDSIQNSFDSLGDENELDIDFGVFRGAVDSTSLPQESKLAESGNSREIQDQEEQKQYNGQHRSKDAGRTCKERFSYASFDAGATVIKTHPGAKNPKAVLIENKDSYMLSECSAEDKFIIIELSEDIWMDTLVLANYEFFSSMIRTFRVSVSDRYPVKPDKWRDLGTYEARNSREIQAFLIENPQIWARYLKIEFLSHYGNEYYCPLSLIRVHGTRMLESWKEAEAGMDEEDTDNIDADNNTPENEVGDNLNKGGLSMELISKQESYEQSVDPISTTSSTTSDAVASTSIIENVINTTTSPSIDESLNLWTNSSIHIPLLMDKYYGLPICSPMSSAGVGTSTGTLGSEHIEIPMGTPSEYHTVVGSKSSSTVEVESSAPVSNTVPPQNSQPTTTVNHESVSSNTDAENPNKSTSDIDETAPTSSSITNTKIQEGSSSHKAKSSSTSSSSASLPTVQESFFKAVSRRLQLLEANSTLSLKYIEEQSRILREAFNKVEKKQLQKTTTFLETLNNTVLAELQGFRQQYDEIWQATVISLDTQRAESQREILAISARLNILADEVVFQKRMSIVQSVLLLLCLGLVIFSRVSSTSHFEFYTSRNRGFRGSINFGEDSPSSPESVKYSSYRDRKHWFQAEHSRQHLDESPLRSDSIDQRPLTPISTYSGSERGESP
ncbi:UNC-like C-terminal-domain-containing protein, partial [Xylogone sp. PMI_703]